MKQDPAFYADLHCHSTFSDGTLTPQELIHLAKRIGLSGLSITDHDTLEAYPDAMKHAEEAGLELLPGVELSASHQGQSVHILGYAFSLKSDAIRRLCEKHRERRLKRYHDILKVLEAHDMVLPGEDILRRHPAGSIGRPHIALAMMEKGYVSSVEEAFKKYLGKRKPCHVPGNAFSVDETLDAIRQAGGLAILAHPHLISRASTVSELLKMPFDGIECFYSRFTQKDNKRWLRIAQNRNWLATGGSDFHGAVKPHISLGCAWVSEDLFRTLMNHYIKANAHE